MSHPPGTILQRMYLRERLLKVQPGFFIEVGVGEGHLSSLIVDMGWTGFGYDFSGEALSRASLTNQAAIEAGTYEVQQLNWLHHESKEKADLVVSSMVLEHLDEHEEIQYFKRCEQDLKSDGFAIILAPASPEHWGVEDEIAGHHRRYTFESIRALVRKANWKEQHIAGLTYPLSNWLLPFSNFLVWIFERQKKDLPALDKTVLSGFRRVPLKTVFPPLFGALLNEWALYPFHALQKRFSTNPSSLVIYLECKPNLRGKTPL